MSAHPASGPAYWQRGERLAGAVGHKALAALTRLATKATGQGSSPDAWEEAATMADVLSCYRLLLGRSPDQAGLEHYGQRLHEGLRLKELVDEFVASVEFLRSHRLTQAGGDHPSQAVNTSFGFVLHVDPSDYAVGHTIALTGTYEPEVSRALQAALAPGATFIDIGANAGWFSMLAASAVGPSGRVLAVEPNPANVELLKRSAKENNFTNVEAFTVALADKPGTVALETDGSNGRIIRLDGPLAEPVRASYVVGATTVDSLIASAGIGRVDAMKLDVEGAEPLVLAGAAGLIEKDKPLIVSEFYPDALDGAPWGSAQGYLEQLRRCGYNLVAIGHALAEQDNSAIISLAKQKGQLDLLCRPV